MNEQNLMTNVECPPTPGDPFCFELYEQVMTEKDNEINDLKKLIGKLQERKPDHKETCITELTRIMEDILMMYPDCEINQAQTTENLYKYRMRDMMGPTTSIHEFINKIEMFNHPRSFYMLKNFQVQLESLSWEEEITPNQPSLFNNIPPMSRAIPVYPSENRGHHFLFVEFINNFIINEAGVELIVYSKKEEIHNERFDWSPVSKLKIKYANRATKTLLDYVNALIKDIKKSIQICQNCGGGHNIRNCKEECKGNCPRNCKSHLPKDCPIAATIV